MTFGRACLRVRQNTASRPRAVVYTICERFSRSGPGRGRSPRPDARVRQSRARRATLRWWRGSSTGRSCAATCPRCKHHPAAQRGSAAVPRRVVVVRVSLSATSPAVAAAEPITAKAHRAGGWAPVPVWRPRMRAVDGWGETAVLAYEPFADTEVLGRMAMERPGCTEDAATSRSRPPRPRPRRRSWSPRTCPGWTSARPPGARRQPHTAVILCCCGGR